ncbi:MAG: HAMP domain-containing protein [Bacteroidetes bacterium]|nr:HAMP domain-containing protein [Bacteroidota bacterium]
MNRRFWIFGLLIALLAPATLLIRNARIDALNRHEDALRAAAVTDAYRLIDDDLRAIQLQMLAIGSDIAGEEAVRRGLDAARSVDGPTTDPSLVDFVAGLSLPDQLSIELYTPVPKLVAWLGASMPMDDAPAQPQFLDRYVTAVATDGDRRDALAIWVPVRDGPTVYGVVRVLRILRSIPPVQNTFLQDYDITDTWSRKTHLELRTVYSAPFDDLLPATGDVRLLQGIDGRSLGRVFVDRPGGELLIRNVRDRYDAVAGFWVALAFAWVLAGAAAAYRKAARVERLSRVSIRFTILIGLLIGYRYVLLTLDLPNRLQRGKSPLAPLYDPVHLASTLFEGAMRSIGDVLLSSIFVAVAGLAFFHFSATILARTGEAKQSDSSRGRLAATALIVLSSVLVTSVVVILTRVSSQVITDSTLDFFSRTGLLPENLVLIVFVSLILLGAGTAILFAAGMMGLISGYRSYSANGGAGIARLLIPIALSLAVVALVAAKAELFVRAAPWVGPTVIALLIGAGLLTFRWAAVGIRALTLRNILLAIFWITAIVYPLLFRGLEQQRRNRLVDAVESFDDGRDPRVLFAIDRILLDAVDNDALRAELADAEVGPPQNESDRVRSSSADSIATNILRRSLLASMGAYEVSLTILDASENPIGRYYEADQRLTTSALAELERNDFEIMKEMREDSDVSGPLVEPMTGRRERERFRYQGIAPVDADDMTIGWVMASAEPRSVVEEAVTPFPRVLVPAGFYGNLEGDVSLAEFRDGVLVRNTGSGFGRYRLSEDARRELTTEADVWRREIDRGKVYDTYYHRRPGSGTIGQGSDIVLASRLQAITVFDHLYYLLRLTVSGLFLGIPLYIFGLFRRRLAGLLPAPEVRFRDKVLNAFFAVGLITVAAMGFVGLQVVTGENERAIESWLKQHLERVEKTLFLEAQAGELAYSVMDRTSIDSLAARVGLDLNLYRGTELVASSRPQLVEDGLIDERLPMPAYKALFFDGFRFTATEENIGTFTYPAGFRALTNEEGKPYYVLSVPTLPEQERIEEERARTVAYLFGALLLLVIVVLVTASILANALTRPIMRLRQGLEAVSRGQFTRITPFESRDEFGELVRTFNSMQDQLADSRVKVAQQERQLAWREMARQVAHEIKNPLTPMKLSIQYLRRSFDSEKDRDSAEFGSLFKRITTTLVEQIDALARIANEFSTFARMPQRVIEDLDLNEVVREAATLMEAEEGISIRVKLFDRPLVVKADREELRRIYINLIKNGIQAVPDSRQGKIEIVTRAERANDESGSAMAYSEVKDNGAGIPSELQEKIFEPNFSTKTSGTGLGLAIVRKSIEDLNGEIGFETRTGRGTTFWIRLPLTHDDEPAS